MCFLQCPRGSFNEKRKCMRCPDAICNKICDTRNADGVFSSKLPELWSPLYGCSKIVGNLDIELGVH